MAGRTPAAHGDFASPSSSASASRRPDSGSSPTGRTSFADLELELRGRALLDSRRRSRAPKDIVVVEGRRQDVQRLQLGRRWRGATRSRANASHASSRSLEGRRREGDRLRHPVHRSQTTTTKTTTSCIDAVAAAGNVVLARPRSTKDGTHERLRRRRARRAASTHASATANFPTDPGGSIRRVAYEIDELKSFALVTAERAGRWTPVTPDEFRDRTTTGSTSGARRDGSRRISFSNVYDGKLQAGHLPEQDRRRRPVGVDAPGPPSHLERRRTCRAPRSRRTPISTALRGFPLQQRPELVQHRPDRRASGCCRRSSGLRARRSSGRSVSRSPRRAAYVVATQLGRLRPGLDPLVRLSVRRARPRFGRRARRPLPARSFRARARAGRLLPVRAGERRRAGARTDRLRPPARRRLAREHGHVHRPARLHDVLRVAARRRG